MFRFLEGFGGGFGCTLGREGSIKNDPELRRVLDGMLADPPVIPPDFFPKGLPASVRGMLREELEAHDVYSYNARLYLQHMVESARSIQWDFGDGTPVVTISDTATVVTHEYANNGTYNASVTIYRNSTNLCVGQMAMDIILIKVDISHPYDIQFGQTDIPCPERDVQKTALIPFTSNYDLNSENVTLRFDDVARAAGFIDSTLVVGEKELEFVVPSAADIDEVYSIYIEILSKCSDTVISVPFRLPISGDILEQRGNELIISENHPAISGAVLSDFHWYRKSDSTVVEGQTSSSLSATVLSEGEIANEAYYVCFALSKEQTHQSYTCTCAKYFEEGSANALDNTHTSFSSTLPKKILRNGQIFIQRGEKIYTITGQEIQSY